ncbi:MAG: polysaccharide pyruvyl transferase CsaB [Synergistaceae bacterium]|jgi:polysaccharide pyruvyl transferase CsaB|nr:polysaccharide pyruvyl transferase CsaB [Synergistaceae bacterium]
MASSRRYRAALAGYYGFGNLGDELLLEASIAALSRCGVPREGMVVLSNDPGGSRQKFGVDAVDRWKAGQICRVLGQSETLLLGGGGLFQDATSLRSCVYYWGLVRCAVFRGAVPWALGQSVGPLCSNFSRRLTRDALKRCRLVQVRDKAGLSLCEALGVDAELGHDLVLSLTLGGAFSGRHPAEKNAPTPDTNKTLLVNLRPCAGDFPERFADSVSAYASAFEEKIVGVAFAEEDERLMRRFMDEKRLVLSRIERAVTMEEALRVFQGAGAAAGMRLHFAMLAVLASVPLVVAPYDPKVEAFALDREVPVWDGGPFPAPRLSASPLFSPEFFQEEIDALCRDVLGL